MPAHKPTRPAPGTNLTMPRVPDDATQRALDAIQVVIRQVQAAAATTAVVASRTGSYLGRQILTGSGSGSLPAGTCVVRLRGIGQGGGGGGGTAGAAGAGGSSGAMLDIEIGTPGIPLPTAITWVAGSAAGVGGTIAGTNGTAGSDSTITIAGVTYTMKGGGRGAGAVSFGGNSTAVSAPPAAGTTSGGFVTYGNGGPGYADGVAAAFSGAGGSSPLGAGGAPVGFGGGAGSPGDPAGFGGGGSGGSGGAGGGGAAGGFTIEAHT